jgi:hypothetical protein
MAVLWPASAGVYPGGKEEGVGEPWTVEKGAAVVPSRDEGSFGLTGLTQLLSGGARGPRVAPLLITPATENRGSTNATCPVDAVTGPTGRWLGGDV